MIYFELLVVLLVIFIGARVGGIGLGIFGMIGLGVLVFGFGLKPGDAPTDVMLIIVAVITAAAALQAAGGLDYLVKVAEKILRKNPAMITFLAPIVCYFFTFFSGTGHIAYSLLPIISEIATDSKVRPERPLSISVIASQQAITASPISAATAALLSAELLGSKGITLGNILTVCVPATLIGVIVGAIVVNFIGVPLEKDPEYLRRLKEGLLQKEEKSAIQISEKDQQRAKISVIIFLIGVFSIMLFGFIDALRPSFMIDGKLQKMEMTHVIEIIMMTVAGLILIFTRIEVNKVIAIFGIAWMGDTFFDGNAKFIEDNIENIVTHYPFLFAIALFVMSILLFSQSSTVKTLYPMAVTTLHLPALSLIAMFPAVNGYFFIPNYPTVVAAIDFDRTGTTRIGKYVLNHSFQIPGFVSTIIAIAVGYFIIMFM